MAAETKAYTIPAVQRSDSTNNNLNGFQLAAIAVIVLAVSTNIIWIHVNEAPPRMYDDALYHAESIHLYDVMLSGNHEWFWNELRGPARGIHPPMVKILPVPFHYVFGRATNSGLYAVTALIPIFGLYVFLIARQLFARHLIAFLAVATTCFFPLTYGLSRNLMAEFGAGAAAAGSIYHLIRCCGFRNLRHSIAFAAFTAWGLWWKISFPVFVVPIFIYSVAEGLKSRRFKTVLANVAIALATTAALLLPFYTKGGKAVLGFASWAAETNSVTELWSLGPPLWPSTMARYWLAIVNSGISAYFFVLLVALAVFAAYRRSFTGSKKSWLLLALWFVPAWLFFSVQLMKEERHLFPAYPALGIATGALAGPFIERLRGKRATAAAALLLLWPFYQYLASSFDYPALPRPDIHVGPFKFLVKDLQFASLEVIPSYTFPASPVRWPTEDVVQLIAANSSDVTNNPPRLKVAGDNPFFSGVVIYLQSVLNRVPLTSHGAFSKGLGINWDFVLDLCGPEHIYGPLDEREPVVTALLKAGKLPFDQIGTVRLPTGCTATVYKKRLRPMPSTTHLLREYESIGYPVPGLSEEGQIELTTELTLPLVYIPDSNQAALLFEDNGRPEDADYNVRSSEFEGEEKGLHVESTGTVSQDGWHARRLPLDAVRGKIVDLKFLLRSGRASSAVIRVRNVRLVSVNSE